MVHSKYTDDLELALQTVMLSGVEGTAFILLENGDQLSLGISEFQQMLIALHLTLYSPPADTVQENEARHVSTIAVPVFTNLFPLYTWNWILSVLASEMFSSDAVSLY